MSEMSIPLKQGRVLTQRYIKISIDTLQIKNMTFSICRDRLCYPLDNPIQFCYININLYRSVFILSWFIE